MFEISHLRSTATRCVYTISECSAFSRKCLYMTRDTIPSPGDAAGTAQNTAREKNPWSRARPAALLANCLMRFFCRLNNSQQREKNRDCEKSCEWKHFLWLFWMLNTIVVVWFVWRTERGAGSFLIGCCRVFKWIVGFVFMQSSFPQTMYSRISLSRFETWLKIVLRCTECRACPHRKKCEIKGSKQAMSSSGVLWKIQ